MLARQEWLPSIVKESRVELERDQLSGSRARRSIDEQFLDLIGFQLLDSLASRSGLSTDDGTCVWFELDR
jgi:hypothetical protein